MEFEPQTDVPGTSLLCYSISKHARVVGGGGGAARIRLETMMIKRDSVQQQRYIDVVSPRSGCHEKRVRTMDCSEDDLLGVRRSVLSSIGSLFLISCCCC